MRASECSGRMGSQMPNDQPHSHDPFPSPQPGLDPILRSQRDALCLLLSLVIAKRPGHAAGCQLSTEGLQARAGIEHRPVACRSKNPAPGNQRDPPWLIEVNRIQQNESVEQVLLVPCRCGAVADSPLPATTSDFHVFAGAISAWSALIEAPKNHLCVTTADLTSNCMLFPVASQSGRRTAQSSKPLDVVQPTLEPP